MAFEEQYNRLLEKLANELDITPGKYKVAVERYSNVAKWLEEGVYANSNGMPHIYTQGSFRLGTVVRPIKEGKEADYDIDLVCQFQIDKSITNPAEIMEMTYDRLIENPAYRKLIDDKEARRCWTLQYSEQDGVGFHLDVLPSVDEDEEIKLGLIHVGVASDKANSAIAITDKTEDESYIWEASNPNGFADWFAQMQRPAFEKTRTSQKYALFENYRNIYEMVDDVPDFLIRTPIQRAIQIFKRHRDMRFIGDELEEYKPISIIITTLAAKLYEQEEDLYTTIVNIVDRLDAYARLLEPNLQLAEHLRQLNLIERRHDGTWYIPNPVNPAENFADSWHEDNNIRARTFFQWVSWLHKDLLDVAERGDINITIEALKEHFNENTVNRAAQGIYVASASNIVQTAKKHPPHIEIENPSKPWKSNWLKKQ